MLPFSKIYDKILIIFQELEEKILLRTENKGKAYYSLTEYGAYKYKDVYEATQANNH